MPKLDTEKILIEKVKQDDEQAITEIYKKYREPLYYRAWSILRNDANAQDAVSVTFVRFLKYKHTITNGPLYNWLSTTTRNVCFDMLKGRTNYYSPVEYSSTYYEIDSIDTTNINYMQEPEVIYHQLKDKQEITRMLIELPKDYEDVLLLRSQGYSCSEIALQMGKSENAVEKIQYKAKKKAIAFFIENSPWIMKRYGGKLKN